MPQSTTIIFLSLVLLLISGHTFAQNVPKDFDNTRGDNLSTERTSVEFKTVRKKKKGLQLFKKKTTYERKVGEFNDRIEANAGRNQKAKKEMEKSQYSDPTYFGHKKKPRKNAVGKKRLCKECGIVH